MTNILILIIDYFRIKGFWHLARSLVIPLFIALAPIIIDLTSGVQGDISSILETAINVLGILLGFQIAISALLVSPNNRNIETAKGIKIGVTSFKKDKTLFDELVTDITWTILCTSLSLLLSIIALAFAACTPWLSHVAIPFSLFILSYCICLTVEIAINLYLILKAKPDENNNQSPA